MPITSDKCEIPYTEGSWKLLDAFSRAIYKPQYIILRVFNLEKKEEHSVSRGLSTASNFGIQ